MKSVKIGPFSFYTDNGGLLITIKKDDKEDTYKFDPDETTTLLNLLSDFKDEINAAKDKGAGAVKE